MLVSTIEFQEASTKTMKYLSRYTSRAQVHMRRIFWYYLDYILSAYVCLCQLQECGIFAEAARFTKFVDRVHSENSALWNFVFAWVLLFFPFVLIAIKKSFKKREWERKKKGERMDRRGQSLLRHTQGVN